MQFNGVPDVVFTTSVSRSGTDDCCPNFLSASPAGPFEVPSLSDGGTGDGG